MRICNVTENFLIVELPKGSRSLQPGETIPVPDDQVGDTMIDQMVAYGWLKVLEPGEKAPVLEPRLKNKQPQMAISLIKDREVPVGSSKALSLLKETRDSVPEDIGSDFVGNHVEKKVNIKGQPENIPGLEVTEGDGSMLIKRGAKSTPTKIVNVSAKEIEKQSGGMKIIKTKATSKELNLDTAPMGSVVFNPTGIPGQAKVVSISDLTDAQLDDIRMSTKAAIEDGKHDRKIMQIVNGYGGMETSKRSEYIEAFDDPEILATMFKLERSPALAMKINAKYKSLTGKAILVPQEPKPKAKAKKFKKPAAVKEIPEVDKVDEPTAEEIAQDAASK